MQPKTHFAALTLSALFLFGAQAPALAQGTDHSHDHAHDTKHDHGHDQGHNHNHDHDHGETKAEAAAQIYKGYFDDAQIQPRPLADWQGEWQSVYPHLTNGTLDPVMAHKAEAGEKSAEEYRRYYETGYQTEVDQITIDGDRVSFLTKGKPVTAQYADAGFEVLTYAKGNRGVRYVFEKTSGDAEAPQVIQFSDHAIAPHKADHYHLYWGADRKALLDELTHWPTYYPAALSGAQIVEEMLAH